MGKNQSLTPPYPLILASTSSYRAQLLSQLGYIFSTQKPDTDEDYFKQLTLSPEDLASKISQHKARSVFNHFPNSVVIGSDQVCTMEGKIFSKPGNKEKALEQLLFMQGKEHHLLTAVTICSPIKEVSFLNKTALKMRPLTQTEVERYLDMDKPYDCAGSYKLEGQGIKLFEAIQMSDHTSIIGLPLIELTTKLLELGFSL